MNVLVIAPHPDDETIGCGGMLCLHDEQGDRTAVACLSSGELGLKQLSREKARAVREKEMSGAAEVLAIDQLYFLRHPDWILGAHVEAAVKSLRPILEAEAPRMIYVPHRADGHPDHRAAWNILQQALASSRLGRERASVEVRAYEVWTPLGTHNVVADISAVMLRKMRALREHRSQLGEFDYERAVLGLNSFRGELAAKCRYAEVFQSGAQEESSP